MGVVFGGIVKVSECSCLEVSMLFDNWENNWQLCRMQEIS